MRLRRAAFAALGPTIALSAAACGSGVDALTDEEVAAVDTLVTADLSLEEQHCILGGLVGLGIEPDVVINDLLSPEQQGELLDSTVECVEDLSQIEGFVDSFIAGAAEEGTVLSRDEARCAIRALEAEDADAAVLDCLGDRLGELTDYGDDPVLDLLWEQCASGNAQACDELYRHAPIGSEYETYGRTCAGLLPNSLGLACFDELG